MSLQNTPNGWTYGDIQRFNAVLDAVTAYQAFDYARKIVAPNNQFFAARQQELGQLVLTLGQTFQTNFGQD